MAVPLLAAIADDLTGALEAGAKFASRSLRTLVTTARPPDHPFIRDFDGEVIVFDTESRHLPPAKAAEAVASLAGECRRRGIRKIYKKTDSTLRGNIGAELAGLLTPGGRIFYAPAYPELGRTVSSGRLYVDGVLVHQTAFARDPFEPVMEPEIARLLSPHIPAATVYVAPMHPPPDDAAGVIIFDGETDAHVEHVAHELMREETWVAAGPAGLARAIAAFYGESAKETKRSAGRVLVVNGSLHEASRTQAGRAIDAGWPQVECGSGDCYPAGDWMILRQTIRHGAGTLAYMRDRAPGLIRLIRDAGIRTLVVFGGDTAYALVEEMRCRCLEVLGELLPGITVSRCEWINAGDGERHEIQLLCKAGGYGDQDTLLRIREQFQET